MNDGKSIKFGDPRILFESTTVAPFTGPSGFVHPIGTVVRGSTHTIIEGEEVSLSLPSMAEIVFQQSRNSMEKAEKIKKKALKTTINNGYKNLLDEEQFYRYLQLFSIGILGLYSALETMVFELYIRRHSEKEIKVDGKVLGFKEFTNCGLERKITSIAATLSGKTNIYNTELHTMFKVIDSLRTTVQHWDVSRRDDYFLNLPENHPIKAFVNVSPRELHENTRRILDHYTLKDSQAKTAS
jgi:hypothetical protein